MFGKNNISKYEVSIFDKCNIILLIISILSILMAILLRNNQSWLGIFMSVFATTATTFIVRLSDFISANKRSEDAFRLIKPTLCKILNKMARIISIINSFKLIVDEATINLNDDIIYFKHDNTIDFVDFYKDYNDIREKLNKNFDNIFKEPMYINLNIYIAERISNLFNNLFLFHFEKAILFYHEHTQFDKTFTEIKKEYDIFCKEFSNLLELVNDRTILINEYQLQSDEEVKQHIEIIKNIKNQEKQKGANEVFHRDLISLYCAYNNKLYRIE